MQCWQSLQPLPYSDLKIANSMPSPPPPLPPPPPLTILDDLLEKSTTGDAAAQYTLGNHYQNGTGGVTHIDKRVAFKWYSLAANGGDVLAQYNIALYYENGIGGIEMNLEQAVKWYKLSANGGNPHAQNALGLAYQNGIGTDAPNIREAIKWWRRAAESGNLAAQRSLTASTLSSQMSQKFKLPLSPSRVYHTAFALGFGLLLPWYAFLNTCPYYASLFPTMPVAYWVTIAFNSPQLPSQLLLLALGKWSSPRIPLTLGFLAQAALLVTAPFVAAHSLTVLLILTATAGGATAIIESALFGGCAELGESASSASQAVLAGEGLASVVANVVQIALYFSSPSSRTSLMLVYFALVALVMVIGASLAQSLASQVVAQRVFDKLQKGDSLNNDGDDDDDDKYTTQEEDEEEGGVSTPLILSRHLNDVRKMAVEEEDHATEKSTTTTTTAAAAAAAAAAAVVRKRGGGGIYQVRNSLSLAFGIAYVCWPTLLAIFLSMILTFLVYPGVTSDIRFTASEGGEDSDLYRDSGAWTLLLFFINAVGDLAGRTIAGTEWGSFKWLGGTSTITTLDEGGGAINKIISNRSRLVSHDRLIGFQSLLMRRVAVTVAYNAARVLTLIVFIASARGWRPPHADLIVALNMLVFAITNGHAQSLAMMFGPMQVIPKYRGTAGVLHVLCLIAGLWVGSAGALVLQGWIAAAASG